MIMYSYYCLAALGPQFRKYLWWKKALTIIQMVSTFLRSIKIIIIPYILSPSIFLLFPLHFQVQFVVALIHACLPLFVDCGYQPFFAYTLMAHAVLFWVMFYNFYNKSYNSRNNVNSNRLLHSESTHDDCHANGYNKTTSNGKHSVSNVNGTAHNQKPKLG